MRMFEKIKRVKGPAFDSILLAIIQIVTYVTNIITTKLLSIELSLNEYGTYSTVNSVITIAASLTLFGLGDSLNYFYNRDLSNSENNYKREEYVNTIFCIQLIIGIAVGFILLVFSSAISGYYNNPLVQPLVIIVCLKPWISNATHLYQVLFVSSGKAKLIAVRNFVVSMLKILLILLAIKVFDSLSAIFICLVLLDVLQLLFFKKIFGNIRFKVRIIKMKKDLTMPIIKYALPMGVYFVTTTLMREIDKLVVGRLGTTEELAVYSNCAKTLPLNILITAFATVLVPYIMKTVSAHKYDVTVSIMKKYLSVGYLSVWMFSGALLLCAPEAIRFFYSTEYVVGLPIFLIYIFDGMVQFASVHLVIAASGNAKFLMKLSIVLLILNAILSTAMYLLFDVIGIAMVGPAFATLIISLIYVYVLFFKSSIILHVRIRDFLPIKRMIYYLIQLSLVGMVFYFIRRILVNYHIHWIIVLFGICAGYCVSIILLRVKEYKYLFMEINKLKSSSRE